MKYRAEVSFVYCIPDSRFVSRRHSFRYHISYSLLTKIQISDSLDIDSQSSGAYQIYPEHPFFFAYLCISKSNPGRRSTIIPCSCGIEHHHHIAHKRRPLTMRPSHLFLAAMTGAASLVSAESATADCTTTTTSSTTTESGYGWPTSWPVPTPNSTSSFSTLTATVTYVTDTSEAGSGITTFTSSTGSGTGGGASSSSSTTAVATISNNGATPADGLSGDRSILGLVIFVALSLCLL